MAQKVLPMGTLVMSILPLASSLGRTGSPYRFRIRANRSRSSALYCFAGRRLLIVGLLGNSCPARLLFTRSK